MAHNKKNKDRMSAYLSSKGAAFQDDWSLRSRIAGAEVATGVRGSAAVSQHAAIFQAIPDPTPEQKERNLLDALCKKDNMSYITSWLRLDEQQQVYRCELCQKVATSEHLGSVGHMMKSEEHALSEALGGTGSSRRFGHASGFTGEATMGNITRFWGDSLHGMPVKTMQMLSEKPFTLLGKRLLPEHISRCRLALVSYQGQGKYDRSTRMHYFDELVDEEEVLRERMQSMLPPPNQGWWPVMSFELEQRAKKHFELDYYASANPDSNPQPVSCFYQLLSKAPDVWLVPFAK